MLPAGSGKGNRVLLGRQPLRARRGGLGGKRAELLAAEGRTCEPPTALCRLSKYHPGATGLCWVAGDLGHDLGNLLDELLLTFAGQRRWRGDDLDAHTPGGVRCRGVNRVWVHQVDESGGVVQVERSWRRHTLGAENGHGKLFAKQPLGS